jgi:ribosomal-protein-alanine N-acetyltransferase
MDAPEPLQFRLASMHDATLLAEMSRELIEVGLGWRYTPIRIAGLIRDPETIVLVASEADRIRGFAVMRLQDEQAHLALLCVSPQQQQRGIGRRMTEWLIESAEVAGMVSIRLELRVDNQAALAFYRRLGFTETQLVPGYYSPQIAARQMVRTLRRDAAIPGE